MQTKKIKGHKRRKSEGPKKKDATRDDKRREREKKE